MAGASTLALSVGGTLDGTTMLAADGLGEAAVASGGSTEAAIAGDGSVQALAGGALTCADGSPPYVATRLEYARNKRTVTFVLEEQWCWNGDANACPTNYAVNWVREFRYDSGRARYLDRPLSPTTMQPNPSDRSQDVWTDYDGDEAYKDYKVRYVGGQYYVSTSDTAFEPGVARMGTTATSTSYYHANHLGTIEFMSDSTGAMTERAVYTAFGERITGPTITSSTRFGYVGEHGYQAHGQFPFLHVGARYYDPGSGRFLQRDPIGIQDGTNVYAYVRDRPTTAVDPEGLWFNFVYSNTIRVLRKISTDMAGHRPPAVAAPVGPVMKALEGSPDGVRIYLACGHRNNAFRKGSSADEVLEIYDKGHATYVKAGKGD